MHIKYESLHNEIVARWTVSVHSPTTHSVHSVQTREWKMDFAYTEHLQIHAYRKGAKRAVECHQWCVCFVVDGVMMNNKEIRIVFCVFSKKDDRALTFREKRARIKGKIDALTRHIIQRIFRPVQMRCTTWTFQGEMEKNYVVHWLSRFFMVRTEYLSWFESLRYVVNRSKSSENDSILYQSLSSQTVSI